ncbi:MAG: DUF6597 domain-containing transcriptional factor [Cytophagales bacterium]|nr:DUF6597 domain-containing transcriptional factor [Cytophagales bacterium]
MITQKFEASPALSRYIKCYWYYHVKPKAIKLFEVLPDGHFDLVLMIKAGKILDTRLTGIWTKSASISYDEEMEVLGVCFNPIAAGGLLPLSIKSLLDDSESNTLNNFNLNEQLIIGYLSQPQLLVHYLNLQFEKFLANNFVDLRVKKCFELVDDSDGKITVKEISEIVGLSPRQIHRLVTNMIGIGIKEYAQITRFKRSLVEVKKSHSNYYHYYDQSHFIREVKKYAGFQPQKMDLRNDDRFIQYYYFPE